MKKIVLSKVHFEHICRWNSNEILFLDQAVLTYIIHFGRLCDIARSSIKYVMVNHCLDSIENEGWFYSSFGKSLTHLNQKPWSHVTCGTKEYYVRITFIINVLLLLSIVICLIPCYKYCRKVWEAVSVVRKVDAFLYFNPYRVLGISIRIEQSSRIGIGQKSKHPCISVLVKL